MALSNEQQLELQTQLQQAVIACNERCLYFAAKWAAELLNSFASHDEEDVDDTSDTDVDDDNDTPHIPPANHDRKEARLEAKELPRFLLAKSYFDCREFDRCSATFLPSQVPHGAPAPDITSPSKPGLSSPFAAAKKQPRGPSKINIRATKHTNGSVPKHVSQRSLFLALYARYMAGEKRKNEDSETVLGPSDGPMTANKQVPGVVAILEEYFNSRGGLQDLNNSTGWLDYLYGLILIRFKSEALAKQWLLRAVNLQPYNWSAWLELASLIASPEEMQQISEHLPQNIMSIFFHIHCNQELYQQTPEVFNTLAQMQAIFPLSAFLQQQKAMLHYHAHEYEVAMQLFDNLARDQPHRLDGMEVYSNLLFVLGNRPRLANLASTASDTDKFRPETNCILGNYYGLISEHEKAVLLFRRALNLDRNFQAAWTLMGHEYIELKNTQAAIESYRRAVDTNRKDYRAWYGLGQGYEMLECYSYSLFYYQRAAALYPGDPKMWAAVGNAYSKCNKAANAIQAYKRALVVGAQPDASSSFGSSAATPADPLAQAVGGMLDPQILYDIACLYEREGADSEAAAYMELALAQEEGAEEGEEGLGVTQVTCKARLWLARWSFGQGEWQRTMELANELCEDGWEVEEAKGLARDVRGRLNLADEEVGSD
ncbi:Anaphase-promoting complex subunit 8 [Recurvomyces mirabilis]|uniref:Anaphase-promoting complex subunit 8 n=1 Tax=Recurvomyces mirabilis TaxID=574656 RepID=A0AAE0WWM1_9PEZI|nr:Anaphase-promoting complex subunit 8 [Recurvomyces mirabilis]KAK5161770.1 Anaphase-promoting complex subunit 8 [Recurvomyces mirabilis]